MSFFKELFKRLTIPTPAFFKKIAWFGGILSAFGLGFGLLAGQFADVAWVVWIDQFSNDIAAAGAIILFVASLTAKPVVQNENL